MKPPPFERSNWKSMNEGQKRYAMEQYNLAKVRRGEYFSPPGPATIHSNIQIEPSIDDIINTPKEGEKEVINELLAGLDMNPTKSEGTDDAQLETPAKKPKLESTATSSAADSPSSKKAPSAKQLPAKPKGSNGGDANSNAMGGSYVINIPRGPTVHRNLLKYTKQWKFFSYGIADQIIKEKWGTDEQQRMALTTGLVNLPWEYAFMYISPAEWERLKKLNNAFAVRCNIKVRVMNTRVAFITNTSDVNNATFNQNKFIRILKGARERPYFICNNRKYLYDTSETMKPIGFSTDDNFLNRFILKEAMYGQSNDLLNTANPPTYITGGELNLDEYLTFYTNATVGDFSNFPIYNKECIEMNAADVAGQIIIDETHEFGFAPLSLPNDMPDTKGIMSAANAEVSNTRPDTLGTERAIFTDRSSRPQQVILDQSSWKFTQSEYNNLVQTTGEILYYEKPMEQSGVYTMLKDNTIQSKCQTSLHVGLRAVPKLTASDSVFLTSWLDTQAYYIVDCEMDVVTHDEYVRGNGGPYMNPANTYLIRCKNGDIPLLNNYDKFFGFGEVPINQWDLP